MYLLALRISDLQAIKKGQIKNKREKITERKTSKVRELYVSDECMQLIHNLEETTAGDFLLDRMNDSTYRRAVKRYCKKAKINSDRVSTHSFRKSMATAVESIKGLKMAQILLNHTNINTTTSYLDDSRWGLEQALEQIGSSS